MRYPLALLAATCVLLSAAPAQAITTTSDAAALANSALRSPATLLGASWDVSADAIASAIATEPLQGFPTDGSDYLILSSGNAAEAANPDQTVFASAVTNGGTRGGAGDVVALRLNLDVPAGSNCLTLSFRYLSEEWPMFVGQGYNDGFLAELDPSEPWTMTNHEIAAPAAFAFMPGGEFVSINAATMTAEGAAGTVYDGGTELLSAAISVTPGSHALVLSVWDDGDLGYDSAAFIDGIAMFTAPQGGCVPGAIVLDPTPPETSVDSGPSGQSSSAAATFGFSADDAEATFECMLDDGAWTSCISPQAYGPVGDGPHTFSVRALDALGSVDATPASRSWTVDTTAPGPPDILAGPSGTTEEVLARFALAGEPGATLECRVDGGAWVVCSDSLDLDGLTLGQHVLEVRQVDAAGNVSGVAERVWTITLHAVTDRVAGKLTGSVGSRFRRGGRRIAVVDGGHMPVGCTLDRGAMRRCTVQAWVAGKLVGRGSARYRSGTRSGRVKVELSPGMHARLGQSRRMPRTIFAFRADVVGRAKPMTARRTAFLAPRRQWILPSDGLFDTGSARLLPHVRAYLRSLAPELESARAIHCVGHTDSIGTHAANKRLGLRRARAVCTQLRRLGFRGRRVSSSRGETSPRATNRTRAGRWSNRRVQLHLLR